RTTRPSRRRGPSACDSAGTSSSQTGLARARSSLIGRGEPALSAGCRPDEKLKTKAARGVNHAPLLFRSSSRPTVGLGLFGGRRPVLHPLAEQDAGQGMVAFMA